MEDRKNKSSQENATRALVPNNLRASIDKALQCILLHQPPEKTECELPCQLTLRMPAERIGPSTKEQSQAGAQDRDRNHRQSQQFQRRQEVIEAEPQIAQTFTMQNMRSNRQDKSQSRGDKDN